MLDAAHNSSQSCYRYTAGPLLVAHLAISTHSFGQPACNHAQWREMNSMVVSGVLTVTDSIRSVALPHLLSGDAHGVLTALLQRSCRRLLLCWWVARRCPAATAPAPVAVLARASSASHPAAASGGEHILMLRLYVSPCCSTHAGLLLLQYTRSSTHGGLLLHYTRRGL